MHECKRLFPIIIAALLVSLALNLNAYADGVLYVKPGGTGDGSSWNAALGDPQIAIEAAAVDPDITQVWVAKTIREYGQSGDFVASQKGAYIAGSSPYMEFSVYTLKLDGDDVELTNLILKSGRTIEDERKNSNKKNAFSNNKFPPVPPEIDPTLVERQRGMNKPIFTSGHQERKYM